MSSNSISSLLPTTIDDVPLPLSVHASCASVSLSRHGPLRNPLTSSSMLHVSALELVIEYL